MPEASSKPSWRRSDGGGGAEKVPRSPARSRGRVVALSVIVVVAALFLVVLAMRRVEDRGIAPAASTSAEMPRPQAAPVPAPSPVPEVVPPDELGSPEPELGAPEAPAPKKTRNPVTKSARNSRVPADTAEVRALSDRRLAVRPPKAATSPGEKPREAAAPAAREESLVAGRGRVIGPSMIKAVVSDHEKEVASCYREPSARAAREKVEVHLSVAPSGEVQKASVSRRVPGDEVAACITRSARRWRFPAPGGEREQEVVVPFVLVPGTREEAPVASAESEGEG